MDDPNSTDAIIDATEEKSFSMEITQEKNLVTGLKINKTEVLERLKGFTENSKLSKITLGNADVSLNTPEFWGKAGEDGSFDKDDKQVTSTTEAVSTTDEDASTTDETTAATEEAPTSTEEAETSTEGASTSTEGASTTTDSSSTTEAQTTTAASTTTDSTTTESTTTSESTSESTTNPTTPSPSPSTEAMAPTTPKPATETRPSPLAVERNEALGSVNGISSMIMGIVNSVKQSATETEAEPVVDQEEEADKLSSMILGIVKESTDAAASGEKTAEKPDEMTKKADESMEKADEMKKESDKDAKDTEAIKSSMAPALPITAEEPASPKEGGQIVIPMEARSYDMSPYRFKNLRGVLQDLLMNREMENSLTRKTIKTLPCRSNNRVPINPGESYRLFNADATK